MTKIPTEVEIEAAKKVLSKYIDHDKITKEFKLTNEPMDKEAEIVARLVLEAAAKVMEGRSITIKYVSEDANKG